jgi:iron complex transport system ATP-binding protein
MSDSPAVELQSVSVVRDERHILNNVYWTINDGERWVVLGPNGSGKTTTLRVLSAQMHPTSGDAWVLRQQLGHTDVRILRKRIGVVSGSVIRSLRPDILVEDVVLSGRRSALETWWDTYTDEDRFAAVTALDANGVAHLSDRAFNVISEGERQKVLLARALVTSPGLLLLDEPFAGLDLGARERLLVRLRTLFADPSTPPLVLVTHHTEEIPPETTHALLLSEGRVVAAGMIDEVLTSHLVSQAFDLDISVQRDVNGRWSSKVA